MSGLGGEIKGKVNEVLDKVKAKTDTSKDDR